VGLGLIGGIALVLFSDLDLPEALESALPAAETDNAGSEAVDAAANAVSVESGARQAEAGEGAPSKMAPQDAAEPEEGAVEVWTAPPLLEISSPDAADVAGVQVNLDLLEPVASEPTPITSSSALPATGNPTQRPTFIPYDVPPKLENPGEIQRLLERGYPSQLRDAGIEGTVILWIFVDEQGAVQRTEVKESSGYEVMDEAALSTAEKMKFAPAMNRDKATPVWLAQPITFR
jgi:protein TonB